MQITCLYMKALNNKSQTVLKFLGIFGEKSLYVSVKISERLTWMLRGRTKHTLDTNSALI